MQVRHIFVGIDLGDKNSVARIAVDRDKSERFGFLNTRQGRARLFREAKRRSEQADGATIVMAYEASSCGFVLSDEAEALGIKCRVLAPTKMEKSVEQRQHKNDDRDANDVLEKLRGHGRLFADAVRHARNSRSDHDSGEAGIISSVLRRFGAACHHRIQLPSQ